MRLSVRLMSAAVSSLVLGVSPRAGAQPTVEIGATLGLYAPLGSWNSQM